MKQITLLRVTLFFATGAVSLEASLPDPALDTLHWETLYTSSDFQLYPDNTYSPLAIGLFDVEGEPSVKPTYQA